MKRLNKFFALSLSSLSVLFLFFAVSPASADGTTDYNNKVAEAQAKINDLQNQLNTAQANLDSWLNSSNSQAELINTAQTEVTLAQEALDTAEANYLSNKSDYDEYYLEVVDAEQLVIGAISEVNNAADLVDSTFDSYSAAQQNADNAQIDMNNAQFDYDTQLINVGGEGTTPGLVVDVYVGISQYGNPPSRSDVVYTKCKTVSVDNIQANWGGGSIFGCGGDFVMLHYRGYITYPTTTKVYFQAQADDGFYMKINGQQVINDWSLKGCSANSVGMFSFTGGKSYAIDAWFYEWSGGACSTLYYQPMNGQWGVAPGSFFTQDAQATWVKDPAKKVILDQKTDAYVQAVAVEEQANEVYLDAEINYDGKYLTYSMLSQDLAGKRNTLNVYETVMDNSELEWQNRTDDEAVASANLRDLKTEYSSTFNGIQQAVAQVDDLEKQLEQAKIDLKNIPKPTASDKRKPKKNAPKYLADGAYIPRDIFVPVPK
jgi:peptidoglycan hydrolase CwlO-like protein